MFHALLKAGITSWGEKVLVGHDTRIAAFILDSLQRSRELEDLASQPIEHEDGGQVIAAIWEVYKEQKVTLKAEPVTESPC